jgi:hypothetical protein
MIPESVPGSLRHKDLTHTLKQGHASPVELILGPVRPRRLPLHSVQYTLISPIYRAVVLTAGALL